MISMSALLIVIGVCALVGIYLFVMHLWLGENESPRPETALHTVHLVPRAA